MINAVRIKNFLPFRDEVILPFANQGLVLIRAHNKVSASADSNGAGKTSLIHALSWGDFGEDLVGRSADDVACRFNNEVCLVQIDHEDALGKWSVIRTRRPTSLSVTGIPGAEPGEDMKVTQHRIEQRLGYGLRTFRNAVIFGQGAFDRFATADQAEQMRMLDEIRGLDFTQARKRVKEWRDGLQVQKNAASDSLTDARIKLGMVEGQIAELTRIREQFVAKKNVELVALTARHDELKRRLTNAQGDLNTVESDEKLLAAMKAEEVIEQRLSREAGILNQSVETQRVKASAVVDDLTSLEDRLAELLGLNKCPTCRQPTRSKAAIRKLFGKELKDLEQKRDFEADAAQALVEKHQAAVAAHIAQYDKLVDMMPEVERSLTPTRYMGVLEAKCSQRAKRLRQDAVAILERDVTVAARDLEVKKSESWSGAAVLSHAHGQQGDLNEEIRVGEIRLAKLIHMLAIADYWVEAFGDRGIRSLLVDADADFINERLVYHLDQLAGGEVQVVMSAQTTLKKGGAKERISFTPVWSWGGSGAGTGSGGQDRRVDLAVFASMQDLAERRSVRPFPLKVWDEPGDALDSRGQDLFLQWVTQEARRRGTGLLITHSAQLAEQAEPDHVWTVVMEKGGARVEISDT